MKKKPKSIINPNTRKIASSIESPDSYKSRKPSWAFSKANINDKWSCLNAESIIQCVRDLSKFENMTWGEIQAQTHDGRNSNHYIKEIEKLHKDARKILSERALDSDCLFSLRITNIIRIYGVLEETGIYYVLWYDDDHGDNDHCVYRARKKHT